MATFSGKWLWGSSNTSTIANYAGNMDLRQEGERIRGEYNYPGFLGIPIYGNIDGMVKGNVVSGSFNEGTSKGQFEWTMSPDETSFKGPYNGTWGNGWWIAKRA